jgi:hypothetical protein
MPDYRIDCVNKPKRNCPHEHITHVGGPNPDGNGRWKDTVPHVVQFIENKHHRFYTKEGNASALGRGPDQRSWQQLPTDTRRRRLEGQPLSPIGMLTTRPTTGSPLGVFC